MGNNHRIYHEEENLEGIPPRVYNGKWTGCMIELDQGGGEIFVSVSVRGLDVPVRVEVTDRTIKIYLV